MFKHLGEFISRHWLFVLVAWGLLALVLHATTPRWDDVTRDGDLAYLPAKMESVEGELLMSKAFPAQRAKSAVAILLVRHGRALEGADIAWAEDLADYLEQHATGLPIVDIWSRATEVLGEKLVSKLNQDGQATAVVVNLSNEFIAVDNIKVLSGIKELVAEREKLAARPAGLELAYAGSAALGADTFSATNESIANTEKTTVLLVVCILLVVYRAPVLVALPLLTIGLSLVCATDILAALTQANRLPGFEWWNFKIFTTTKIFIVVILFGAGTDFCLFLISRFKEELDRGLPPEEAVAEAVAQVGEALLGSALTTICGLGMLFFAAFGKFSNSGPAIATSLVVALLACLTFAPALLVACGNLVFWPFKSRQEKLSSDECAPATVKRRQMLGRFWAQVGNAVVKWPGTILIVSVALLAPLAIGGWETRISYDLLNELMPIPHSSATLRDSVQGSELSKKFFSPGETSPITILAWRESGIPFDTKEGERDIALLTKSLYDFTGHDGPEVESVRSLSEPLGGKPGSVNLLRGEGLKKLAARKHKRTRELYLSTAPDYAGRVTRFDVLMRYEPFGTPAIGLVNRIDQKLAALSADPNSPWHKTDFRILGATSGIRDLQRVTQSDQVLIQRLVVLAVLTVLIVILRRPLICFYLIISVVFSYWITIGATEMFFEWLYADTFSGLDWKVPIFLFVILIAIGEDYNIYLVTRVFEEQERHGRMEGLCRAVACTGGIITSCGVIMAGTFISMMSGSLRGMMELGFALSLGVMLDTCVVRPVLVPSFMALMYRFEGHFRSDVSPPAPPVPHSPGIATVLAER